MPPAEAGVSGLSLRRGHEGATPHGWRRSSPVPAGPSGRGLAAWLWRRARPSRCDFSCRLENCHLTNACCRELRSSLMINQRLTHLCLAENDLGDSGVMILCQALSYPESNLQMLV